MGPLAVIVTELLREWSAPPLTAAFECATAGAPTTAGTAGMIVGFVPFMGVAEAVLACCCDGIADPTTGGWDPFAITGVAAGFLEAPAAEAYDAVDEAVGVGAGLVCGFAGDVIWVSVGG